jgi:hypothetical protein
MILLFPLIGMEFNGKSLRFGDTRAEVENILSPAGNVQETRSYYLGGELALDFDEAGELEFIEFLGGIDGTLQPELYGKSVFHTTADEVLELLGSHGSPVDEDGGYTVVVPEVSLGLYREITPGDVEEMVRELMNVELTALGHIDLESENRRANHWGTIGIGKKDYYAHLR